MFSCFAFQLFATFRSHVFHFHITLFKQILRPDITLFKQILEPDITLFKRILKPELRQIQHYCQISVYYPEIFSNILKFREIKPQNL